MIQQAISELLAQHDLPRELTEQSFNEIMSGEATQAQIAAFLTGLAIKGETVEEITACARIMREKSVPVPHSMPVLEIVGTGGDRVGTFNISTASALITAAAGVPTAKHGNRSVSSKCGAADVLEALGAAIDLDAAQNEQVLEDENLCFMFAPVYHASMRYAAPVRQEMGIPTIFNILGPLANPAGATLQLLGVYSDDLVLPMARTLQNLGVTDGMVVHGADGLDEITLTGPTRAALIKDGDITEMTIDPKDFGMAYCSLEELIGGDAEENAEIVREIVNGTQGPQRDVVLLNAGAALFLTGSADTLADGVARAAELIDSGKAREKLDGFVNTTQALKGEQA